MKKCFAAPIQLVVKNVPAHNLEQILQQVRDRTLSPEDARKRLANYWFEQIDEASVDHGREQRTGFGEVILGSGKTENEIIKISQSIIDQSGRVLVTRIRSEQASSLQEALPECEHFERARAIVAGAGQAAALPGRVALVSAGTSDLNVLEEARVTCEFHGAQTEVITDVGVAGLHRTLKHRDNIEAATVAIVIAGMEGALPSVIAGLVSTPVIAVPTSVGYGANLEGIAALLTMLNSCASGVSVVNIDNGFGAAQVACSFLKKLPV